VRYAPNSQLILDSPEPVRIFEADGTRVMLWRCVYGGLNGMAVAFHSKVPYVHSLLAGRTLRELDKESRCSEYKPGCALGIQRQIGLEYDKIRNQLETFLLEAHAQKQYRSVLVTGHGNGGTLATLFGYNWRVLLRADRNGVPSPHLNPPNIPLPIEVVDANCIAITFAASRLGNRQVANAVSQVSAVDRLAVLRFIDDNGEAFAEVPIRGLGFIHAGPEISVNRGTSRLHHFCTEGTSRTGAGVG